MKFFKLFIILCTVLQAEFSFCHEQFSEIPIPQICATNNGYFVYGIAKAEFLGDFYTKDLEKVGSITLEINKKSRFPSFISYENEQISLITKHHRIIINALTLKVESLGPNLNLGNSAGSLSTDNYVPYYTFGNLYCGVKNYIKTDNNYLELLQNSTGGMTNLDKGVAEVMEMKKKYNGGTQIRSFTKNEDLKDTYKLNWAKQLDHGIIIDMEWFDFGNELLFLQVSEFGNTQYETDIYAINRADGEIRYKYDLNLDYDATPYLSKAIIDEKGQLILIGNSIDELGRTGWYTQVVNVDGDKILEKFHPIENTIPKNFKGDDLIGSAFINFQSCKINERGNVELIGQNMRYFTVESLSIEVNSNTGATKGRGSLQLMWQPYGYSYFELNSDHKIEKNDYEEVFYTDESHEDGRQFLLRLVNTPAYSPDIFNLIKGAKSFRPFVNTIINSNSLDSSKSIIYKELDPLGSEFNYYYMTISGNNKGKKVFLSKVKDDLSKNPIYFFKSANEIVEFKPDSKSYTLRIIKV